MPFLKGICIPYTNVHMLSFSWEGEGMTSHICHKQYKHIQTTIHIMNSPFHLRKSFSLFVIYKSPGDGRKCSVCEVMGLLTTYSLLCGVFSATQLNHWFPSTKPYFWGEGTLGVG